MSKTVTNKKRLNGSALGTEDVGKLMLKYSIPAIVSGLVSAIYNIVDQIFIGWGIGDYGMAATNVAFPLVTISTAVALLFGVGGASNFNLHMGRGEPEKASDIAGNALSGMTIVGVLIAIIATVFLEPLLVLFGATDLIMPYAIPYTIITNIGIPFAIFSNGASNLIRADGSPTYSMVCMLSGAIFNIIFDPIFLFVFDMGIAGIALATTLGQMLSSILALIYLIRNFETVPLEKKNFIPKFSLIAQISALGAAASFNQLAMTLVQIVKSNMLRHYGAMSIYGSEIPLAAVGATSKIMVILFSMIIGIAQGSQPIMSYNYGAKKYDRVKETVKLAIISATVISVISFLLYQIFPNQLMAIYGSENELFYEFSSKYLRIFMLMTFINGIQPIVSNFFTSIGKSVLGLWMSLTRQVIFLTPLMIILPKFLGMDGVLWSGPISDTISAVLAIVFLVREIRIINELQQEQQLALQ